MSILAGSFKQACGKFVGFFLAPFLSLVSFPWVSVVIGRGRVDVAAECVASI